MSKKQAIESLLARGHVFVFADTRREGVVVPEHCRGKPALGFLVGYQLTPAIPDLECAELALVGTLAFSGKLFRCVLPWTAIFAARCETGEMFGWPEDAPPEIALESAEEPAPPPVKRHLRSVN